MSTSKVQLTEFEANLLRLLYVYYRFWGIYKEFPNHMKKGMNHLLVKQILRETAIVQLGNFLRIRNDLLKNSEFRKLDVFLKPLVEEIEKCRKPMKLIRDNYIAHVQDKSNRRKKKPFEIMLQEICEQYQLPTTWAYWEFLCGCAWFYCGFVDVNFKKELDKAEKKHQALQGLPLTISSGYKMRDVRSKLKPLLKKVNDDLKKNGFKLTR